MAKTNGKIKLIVGVIIIAGIFAGLVTTWAGYGTGISINTGDITSLEIEGCKPSGKNEFDIALIQKDIDTIQKSQADMRAEQKVGFKEILDRLPK